MTLPMQQPPRDEPPRRPRVDAGQLWAGGAATAVVAALVALVGILVCRWLFKIPILAPQRDGAWGDASTGAYVAAAAAVAIVATALVYLLAVAIPRPSLFFAWIIGLVTVVGVVFPFSTTASLSQKAATALVNLVLGVAIASLLSVVATRATRLPPPSGDFDPRYPAPARTPEDQDSWDSR
jgi:Family of unknown function (DUF6069)